MLDLGWNHGRRGRGGPPMPDEAYPRPESRVTAETLLHLYPFVVALRIPVGGGLCRQLLDGVKLLWFPPPGIVSMYFDYICAISLYGFEPGTFWVLYCY